MVLLLAGRHPLHARRLVRDPDLDHASVQQVHPARRGAAEGCNPLVCALGRFHHRQSFCDRRIEALGKAERVFSGFGRNKSLALYDILVARHDVPELVVVVAHEVEHYKLKRIVKGMAMSVVHTGALFFLISRFIADPELFAAFDLDNPTPRPFYIFLYYSHPPVIRRIEALKLLSRD